jgi:hypothetical protein
MKTTRPEKQKLAMTQFGRPPVLGSNEQIFGANKQVPKGGCGPCPKNAPGPGNSLRDILIFAGGGLSVWWRRRQKIG